MWCVADSLDEPIKRTVRRPVWSGTRGFRSFDAPASGRSPPLNLLGRARKMIQGLGPADPPKPQYYRVACSEGHPLRGERTESYQALRCPACGEGIFVLPRSPLPDPPAPPSDRPKKRLTESLSTAIDEGPILLTDPPMQPPAADAEIEWDDEPPARREADVEIPDDEPAPPVGREDRGKRAVTTRKAPADAVATPKPRSPQSARPQAASIRPAGSAVASAAPAAIAVPERIPLSARIRRHRHALLFVGIVLLVAGTFGIRALRERKQNLPQIAEKNTGEGLAALQAGEFDIAKTKLGRAARALEELGDEEAYKIRQAANEAAILADLAGASLEEMVEDVATREDGSSKLDTLYKGRSVLLEAEIAKLGGKDKGNFQLDYFILGGAGSKPKRGVVDLAGLKLFDDARPKPGETVTFGARLQSITLGDDGLWHIQLAPESGVRMISPQAWKALELLEFTSPNIPPEEPR